MTRNGNLTNDGTRSFAYSAENQLTNITLAGTWKTEFVYDGLGRRRMERDYGWQGGSGRRPTRRGSFMTGIWPFKCGTATMCW